METSKTNPTSAPLLGTFAQVHAVLQLRQFRVADKNPNLVQINFLGAQAMVQVPNALAQLIEQAG